MTSFGFKPTKETVEYRRLKWWHLRKTPIRVLHDVRWLEVGFDPHGLFPIERQENA